MQGWAVVVPVKRLTVAKSRLAEYAGDLRGELALAFAADTLAATMACQEVRTVVVVTDEPAVAELASTFGALVVPDEPGGGLNAALRHGSAAADQRWPGTGVAALSGDLPALRPTELARALQAAATHPVAYVPDAEGVGTTLLTARSAAGFDPCFGPGSAQLHLDAGAVRLTSAEPGSPALDSLRRDVDTPADLAAAAALGLGPRTRTVLAALAQAAR
jgi:2-phospho-L-lactate guanylyltransferase